MIDGQHGLLWLAFAFYTLGLLFALWRMAHARPYRRWPKLALLLPGFLIQTYCLWARGLAVGHCPVANLFETLTFAAWCLVALHLIITSTGRIPYLTVFYMPWVLILQLAALVTPTDRPSLPWQEASRLAIHASIIVLGYAAFGLAAAVGLMYLVQERQLRTRRLSPSFMLLPPLLRLELVQAWLVAAGFALLTLGLAGGFVGWHALHRHLDHPDAKLLWSAAVWIFYLVILFGRFRGAIGGRVMAWVSILGATFVLTTFWLSNALSQFHHF